MLSFVGGGTYMCISYRQKISLEDTQENVIAIASRKKNWQMSLSIMLFLLHGMLFLFFPTSID